MRHGYTNSTRQVPEGVLKSYTGPDSIARADAEFAALSHLAHVLRVPAVLDRQSDGSVVIEFKAGRHGQDLINEGHAEQVLAACGLLLRRVHSLSPSLLVAGEHPATHVISHGDFGPNNTLHDPDTFAVTALLDWEFSEVGPPINDLAWCEWIVRMHHPAAVSALPVFFDAYGRRPPWGERQRAMADRCRWLEALAHKWNPTGEGVCLWQERARLTASWTEQTMP